MKHILFPVDFSSRCDAMAPAVAALARKFGACVSMLHVMQAGSLEGDFAAFQHHFATLREEVQGLLTRYQASEFQGLPVDRFFKIGRAVDEIVEFARATEAELIMMPTHGRSRFRELLLGSVTAGVLHDTYSAVLTSAHMENAPAWTLPRSIVCAIDMSPYSTDVLDMADHFAIHCGAALRVVHAVTGAIDQELDLRVDDARRGYFALAREAEVHQPLEIVNGSTVAGAILATCDRYGADLLVAGRGQMQGVLGRLRSGVHELVRRSRCPVLSV